MPIYEYACTCGKHFEEMQPFHAPPVAKCPKCGKRAKRIISLAAFHLKGSGWYATDSKSASGKGHGGKPKADPAEPSAATETKPAAETKPAETKPAESKPADKKKDHAPKKS